MTAFSPRSTDRIAIVGRTGSGKTYFAKRLIRNLSRLVVLDPKGTLNTRNGTSNPRNELGLTDWGDGTLKRLRRGDPGRWRIGPTQVYGGDWEPVLADLLKVGGITVYIDELYLLSPNAGYQSPGLRALYTQGRELGIGVWGCMQRPTWVPLFTLSESEWVFQFRLRWAADRQRMAEEVGLGEQVLQNIPDRYGFWMYHIDWDAPKYYRTVGT